MVAANEVWNNRIIHVWWFLIFCDENHQTCSLESILYRETISDIMRSKSSNVWHRTDLRLDGWVASVFFHRICVGSKPTSGNNYYAYIHALEIFLLRALVSITFLPAQIFFTPTRCENQIFWIASHGSHTRITRLNCQSLWELNIFTLAYYGPIILTQAD